MKEEHINCKKDIERDMSNLKMLLESERQNFKAEKLSMEMQISNLLEKIGSDNDFAGTLEEYKKRAQLALKKANANISTLTTENSVLKKSKVEYDTNMVCFLYFM